MDSVLSVIPVPPLSFHSLLMLKIGYTLSPHLAPVLHFAFSYQLEGKD